MAEAPQAPLEQVWLSSPSECEAHLVYVAVEGQTATLSTDELHFQGRLGPPNRSGQVPFSLHPAYEGRPVPVKARCRVRLDYQARGVSYSFRTRLVRREPDGRLLLELPNLIGRTDRRLVFRFVTAGDPSFQVSILDAGPSPVGRETQLVDLSTDGLAWHAPDPSLAQERGDLACVALTLPAVGPLVGLARVANVRPHPGEGSQRVVGARFLDLDLEQRMNIALSLSIWNQARQNR